MHPSARMPENRNHHDDPPPSEPHARHLDDRNRQPMRDERDDWRGDWRGRYPHSDPFVERERLGYGGYERRPTGYTYGYGYGYDDGGMEDRDRPYSGYGQGPQPSTVRFRELHPRGPHRGKGPRGFQRSDERIKELVNEALTDHDEIDATDIEVAVKGGEVTLTGTVDDRRTKRMAEDCVERISGVVDVQNQLKIGMRDSRSTHSS